MYSLTIHCSLLFAHMELFHTFCISAAGLDTYGFSVQFQDRTKEENSNGKNSIGELEKSCLLAAIQGYTTNGMQPREASRRAIELVRCLSKEMIQDGDTLAIDTLNRVEQFEMRIGRKLGFVEKHHVREVLNDGMSIDEVLAKNPRFKDLSSSRRSPQA